MKRLVLFLGALFLTFSWLTAGETAKAGSPLIKVSYPVTRDFYRTVPFMGEVVSKRRVELVALTSGRIVSIRALDESPVKKSEILFVLGGPEVEKRLGSLKARLAALKKEIALAQESVRLKEKGAKIKVVPYREVLSAREQLLSLQAEFKAVQTELTTLRAGLQVKAPISGVFTRRRVSIGQEVEKGTVLAEVVDSQALWIKATVFLPHKIPLCGRYALIKTEDKSLMAKVVGVSPEQTPAGGTVVFLEGKEIFRNLAPGQTVSGKIILEEHKGVFALPGEAVVYDEEERAYVFVKSGNDFERRRVQTGLAANGFIEIVSGLKRGEKVVIQGAYELFYRNFNQIYKVPD